MSLGIVFKGPEGIVLAADSRVTLMAHLVPNVPQGAPQPPPMLLPSTFDNATKLLRVKGQSHAGAVTFGAGAIGLTAPRTAHSFLPELEKKLAERGRLSVEDFANELGQFFLQQWTAGGMPAHPPDQEQMVFFVAGFDDNAVYGRVFEIHIPNQPAPKEWFVGAHEFGAIWGGQNELVHRLINGFDPRIVEMARSEFNAPIVATQRFAEKLKGLNLPIPYQFLPLQDSIDLAIFLVRMTLTIQKWQIGVRGVGGAVDVATITQTGGFEPIQQKAIRGEVIK
jgi:hypothetical protein